MPDTLFLHRITKHNGVLFDIKAKIYSMILDFTVFHLEKKTSNVLNRGVDLNRVLLFY